METTETISETRRLTRPRDGRWFGGVAAGLGAYFDLSPAIYRIAFVALALAGGTGILLYLAAWPVIPEEGEADSVAAASPEARARPPARAVGIAATRVRRDPRARLRQPLARSGQRLARRRARRRGARLVAARPPRGVCDVQGARRGQPLPAGGRRPAGRGRRDRAARSRRRVERRLALGARRDGRRTRRRRCAGAVTGRSIAGVLGVGL